MTEFLLGLIIGAGFAAFGIWYGGIGNLYCPL
jgi:hypothetical protein